eukprot:1127781-Rhodomonas_salina.2
MAHADSATIGAVFAWKLTIPASKTAENGRVPSSTNRKRGERGAAELCTPSARDVCARRELGFRRQMVRDPMLLNGARCDAQKQRQTVSVQAVFSKPQPLNPAPYILSKTPRSNLPPQILDPRPRPQNPSTPDPRTQTLDPRP